MLAQRAEPRKGFTWNGRANRKGVKVSDGVFFVRYRTRYGKLVDTRRTVLRRANGRFTRRPQFHRRSTCGTLESFKLERAVFGGTRQVPLRIAYRLKRRARVTVQVRRGGKVVRSFKARTTRGGRTVRLRYPARSARRGDHRVRITVVRGGRRTVATLTSRRL